MTKSIRAKALCAAVLTLAGCSRGAPTGQVVANVNGEEITRRDLEAELGGVQIDPATMKKVQPLAVEQIVNRKLMVAEAEREGLAKSPDFLAAERRGRDVLLLEMLQRREAASSRAPDPGAVRAFIAANPQMFLGRRILHVDQIRTTVQGLDSKALAPLTSMDQIAAYLNAQNKQFERVPSTIDTASLSRDVVRKIDALAPGMPFVGRRGDLAVINAITGSDASPVPPEQQQAAATRAIREAATGKALEAKLKSLRRSAKIEYQPGFAPPPPDTGQAIGSERLAPAR